MFFYLHGQRFVLYNFLCMFQDSSCSRSIGRCSRLVGVLVWHFSRFLSVSVFLRVGTPWRLSPLPCPSLSFHCFISVTGAWFFSFRMGAHGWVAWSCKPWERSPSRSWLPIVEAPGCVRDPTSTLRGS